MLPPPPPPLANPPELSGRRLDAYGTTWLIEMLGMWKSEPGFFTNVDILCRLTEVSGKRIHSLLVETDRLFFHLPSHNERIVDALESALADRWMPLFVHIEAA